MSRHWKQNPILWGLTLRQRLAMVFAELALVGILKAISHILILGTPAGKSFPGDTTDWLLALAVIFIMTQVNPIRRMLDWLHSHQTRIWKRWRQ